MVPQYDDDEEDEEPETLMAAAAKRPQSANVNQMAIAQ